MLKAVVGKLFSFLVEINVNRTGRHSITSSDIAVQRRAIQKIPVSSFDLEGKLDKPGSCLQIAIGNYARLIKMYEK